MDSTTILRSRLDRGLIVARICIRVICNAVARIIRCSSAADADTDNGAAGSDLLSRLFGRDRRAVGRPSVATRARTVQRLSVRACVRLFFLPHYSLRDQRPAFARVPLAAARTCSHVVRAAGGNHRCRQYCHWYS